MSMVIYEVELVIVLMIFVHNNVQVLMRQVMRGKNLLFLKNKTTTAHK